MVVPLIAHAALGKDIHKLTFAWDGERPGAGQFFMIKPARTNVFLGRPVSVFSVDPLAFVVARKGAGTKAICAMRAGDEAELIGPLGNTFGDFVPGGITASAAIALAGGGIGAAPLHAFADELTLTGIKFAFFAGFKTAESAFLRGDNGHDKEHRNGRQRGHNLTVVTEDGSCGAKGFVTDVFDPLSYAAVFACGPLPMLQAVYRKCAAGGVPCFVSMEKRMACGVGACLGCRIETKRGGMRCCKDGPVFGAGDIAW